MESDSKKDIETKKINYWLEKLFNQAREKEKKEILQKDEQQVPSDTLSPESIQPETLTTEEKGIENAIKNHAAKEEKNRQTVEDMVSNSNRILLKTKSVFPWDFFPSSIILEETRLTIIRRQFYSSQVRSVDIKNISNVFINTGLILARLTIVSDTFVRNQIDIGHLWKKDAILMRRIIEGMRLFIAKDIDTTSYTTRELVHKLKELSTTEIVL